jgi:hypothetical protein
MRRSAHDRVRTKPHSQTGSVAGEDADLSDVEPSESGSLGGRSNATGGSSSKKRMTIEEREAAYNEARSRIFMGFEEKEKEKDLNASSSTLSLVSGSASTSGGTGGSSVDDFDDSVSSPATESEWSGPNTRDKRDGRRTGSGCISLGSSSRPLRSAPPFTTNGSGSSRGSRAPSPAFTFASLYEPPPSAPGYDPSHFSGQVPGPGFAGQYAYPYPPPGQPMNPPPPSPYPFFPHYPYPPATSPNSDPSTPASAELYLPQHTSYINPYGWSNQPHPPPMHAHATPPTRPAMNHQNSAPNQNASQYPTPFMASPSPYVHYPMTTYYSPHLGQQGPPLPHMISQPSFPGEALRSISGTGFGNGHRNGYLNGTVGVPNHSRTPSRNSTGHTIPSSGVKQSGLPPPRSVWGYGSGIGTGNFSYGGMNGSSGDGNETVGPRLSSTMRRGSGSGISVGSTGNRTSVGDEASSTAVSYSPVTPESLI